MRNETTHSDLKDRTRTFALRVVRMVSTLGRGRAAGVMGNQLLRCATSVGANYRAARRARSRREFIAKLGIVEEELDEAIYWMELFVEAGLVEQRRMQSLLDEANELLSIVVASIRTARRRRTVAADE